MEITELSLYWILKLDEIRAFCLFLGLLQVIILIIALVALSHKWEMRTVIQGGKKEYRKAVRVTGLMFLLVLGTGVLFHAIPSTKQMIIIKGVPALLHSKAADKMTGDAEELYNLGVEAAKKALTEYKK